MLIKSVNTDTLFPLGRYIRIHNLSLHWTFQFMFVLLECPMPIISGWCRLLFLEVTIMCPYNCPIFWMGSFQPGNIPTASLPSPASTMIAQGLIQPMWHKFLHRLSVLCHAVFQDHATIGPCHYHPYNSPSYSHVFIGGIYLKHFDILKGKGPY